MVLCALLLLPRIPSASSDDVPNPLLESPTGEDLVMRIDYVCLSKTYRWPPPLGPYEFDWAVSYTTIPGEGLETWIWEYEDGQVVVEELGSFGEITGVEGPVSPADIGSYESTGAFDDEIPENVTRLTLVTRLVAADDSRWNQDSAVFYTKADGPICTKDAWVPWAAGGVLALVATAALAFAVRRHRRRAENPKVADVAGIGQDR